MTKEKTNFERLQNAYNEMEKSFVRDEAVLEKRDDQVKKFIMAKLNEDTIVNKAGKELKNVSLTPLIKVADESHAVKKLEKWISNFGQHWSQFCQIDRKKGWS